MHKLTRCADCFHYLSFLATLSFVPCIFGEISYFQEILLRHGINSALFQYRDLYDNWDALIEGVGSKDCVSQIKLIHEEFQRFMMNESIPEAFLLQMADAWGKLPSGILSGHLASPGDFEECVGVRGALNGTDVQGSYCTVYLFPNEEIMQTKSGQLRFDNSLRRAVTIPELVELMQQESALSLMPSVGTCFPAVCSTADTQQFISKVLNITGSDLGAKVLPCVVDKKPEPDVPVKIMLVIVGIILGLGLLGTCFDVVSGGAKSSNRVGEILRCFSWYNNTLKWNSTNSVGKDNLGCFHGLRFLSMVWVVLGHSWMLYLIQNPWNAIDVKLMYEQHWTLLAVVNGTVSVDTFFVLSGALVAYNLLKELDLKQRLKVYMLYIHRYLRLTPTYALVIGMYATLLPYAGNGPRWWSIDTESRNCRQYWWHNLLYITTIYIPEVDGSPAMCYSSAWYLSNDMVYFIVSPIFIYTLWRWRNVGIALLLAWIAQSTVHTGILIGEGNYAPTLNYFLPSDDFQSVVYRRPWTRSAPYAVGILLGYLLHLKRTRSQSGLGLSLWFAAAGWALSTAVAVAVVFGPYQLFNPGNAEEIYGGVASVSYGSLHRLAWALVIAWIVFACVSGYGWWINDLLTWKPFIPLGRLTYCVYITAVQLQVIYANLNYHPVHYSVYNAVILFLGNLALCLLVGFVLVVTVEMPFCQLEKLVFQRHSEKEENQLVEIMETVETGHRKCARPTTIWNYYKLVD